jgi:broad specificity phosphatase PhoE
MELSWGDFGVYTSSELMKKWEEHYILETNKGTPREEIRPPKGENVYDHIKKINNFVQKVKSEYHNKTILVVAHGGTNRVLIGLLKNKDPDEYYIISQENACINILELDDAGNVIREEINKTEHLE